MPDQPTASDTRLPSPTMFREAQGPDFGVLVQRVFDAYYATLPGAGSQREAHIRATYSAAPVSEQDQRSSEVLIGAWKAAFAGWLLEDSGAQMRVFDVEGRSGIGLGETFRVYWHARAEDGLGLSRADAATATLDVIAAKITAATAPQPPSVDAPSPASRPSRTTTPAARRA